IDDFLITPLAMRLEADVGTRALDQRGVPLLASVARFALDQVCPVAERHVRAVQLDRLVGPFTRKAKLTPRADGLLRPARRRRRPFRPVPGAGALRAKDSVDLVERESGEWIRLVHDEHEARRRALRIVVRAAREANLERRMAELPLEGDETRLPCAM